jgi:hypothetical protein
MSRRPSISISPTRIEVQDMVRHLGSHPNENDEQVIEQRRHALASMLVNLKQLQDIAGLMTVSSGSEPYIENEGEFDDVEESGSARQTDHGQ